MAEERGEQVDDGNVNEEDRLVDRVHMLQRRRGTEKTLFAADTGLFSATRELTCLPVLEKPP